MICGCSFAGMNDWPPGLKFRKFGARARKALGPEQFQAILVEDCMNEKIVDTTAQRPQKRRVIAELKVMGHFFLLQGLRLLSDEVNQFAQHQQSANLSSFRHPMRTQKIQTAINQMFIHSYTSWRNSS